MPPPKASTPPPGKQVSLKTLAESCGLSVGAVSQCLRDPDNRRFSKATREKVALAARRFGYVPNRLAASLREGRTHALAMVVPWNTPEMLDEAEMEAKKRGYSLSIHFTVSPDLDAERKAIAHAVGQRTDGLLWLPSHTAWGYSRTIRSLRQSGVRTVFLETGLPTLPEAGLVEVDYLTALGQTMRGLRDRGCADFVLVTRGTAHKLRADRTRFFEEDCRENGVASTILKFDSENRLVPVLRELPAGTAVFCEGDWLAIDLLRAAEKAGRNFTGDLYLISIGDVLVGGRYRIGEITQPSFSAIRRPSGELGHRAVAYLIDRIEGGAPEEPSPSPVRLAAEFIPRDTTPPRLFAPCTISTPSTLNSSLRTAP